MPDSHRMTPHRILAISAASFFLTSPAAGAGPFLDALGFGSPDPESCAMPVEIERNVSFKDPDIKAGERSFQGLARHGKSGILMGQAEIEYGFIVDYDMEAFDMSSGETCVRIRSISVEAGRRTPVIWMNPDIERGSCRWDVTLAHEKEHVDNYYAYLDRVNADFRDRLPDMVADSTYTTIASGEDPMEAMSSLRSEVMDITKDFHDSAYRDAYKKDRAMDTKAEYDRLASLCPGSIHRNSASGSDIVWE